MLWKKGCQHTHYALFYWMHHKNPNKTHGEKSRLDLHKNAIWCMEHIIKQQLYGLIPPILPTLQDEQDMLETVEEVK